MQTFFDGKLRIKPLLVTDQPATRPEVVARLVSPGGELAVLADGVNEIRHLGYVELRAGKARGNHYHKVRHENFYVIAGELDFCAQDVETGERVKAEMRAGDFATIDPGVVHTFVPRTAGHALEFAAEAFDAGDVYRVVLV